MSIPASAAVRSFVEASAAKLKEFQERSLKGEHYVALFLDGKTFADTTLVIALGVTADGTKRFLGFVETGPPSAAPCHRRSPPADPARSRGHVRPNHLAEVIRSSALEHVPGHLRHRITPSEPRRTGTRLPGGIVPRGQFGRAGYAGQQLGGALCAG